MKYGLVISLLFLFQHVGAQVEETFEEVFPSEAYEHPAGRWELSNEQPLDGKGSLHHAFNNSDAAIDAISWPYKLLIETEPLEWRFLIRYDYNPSSGNHWAFYLASSEDAQYMSADNISNGLAIGVNLTGSDDTLRIWEVAQGNFTPWLTTNINWQDDLEKGTPINMKVTLTESGMLSVYLKDSDETNVMDFIGSRTFNQSIECRHIGFAYTYTSSADQLLWIDNLYCGPPVADTIRPSLSSWQIASPNSLQLFFSEPMDSASLNQIANYQLQQPELTISEIATVGQNPNSAILTFANEIPENSPYKLNISGLKDPAQNVLNDTLLQFVRLIVHPYDIVINEFMPDPSPSIGLPDEEFIELYNTLPFALSIENMIVSINDRDYLLPEKLIDSAGYLIICDSEHSERFSTFGNTLGIQSMSSLTNTSGGIELRDTAGRIIDSLHYYQFWYGDEEKESGGWSLERVDPQNTCGESMNWLASEDLTGGTPGKINAVAHSNIDDQKPLLSSWTVVSPVQINISFSEPVRVNTSSVIEFNEKHPKYLDSDERNQYFTLILEDTLTSPSANDLHLANIPDYCDNLIEDSTVTITYYLPKFGDVVISELMADPEPGQGLQYGEYIELFNASLYPIQLGGMVLSINNNPSILPEYLLSPSEYLMISAEGFISSDEQKDMEPLTLPAIPNEAAIIELWNTQNELLHWADYSVEWHTENAKMEGGWALEMKNTNLPCQQQSNWGSSRNKEGGTPAKPNSIAHNTPDETMPMINEVSPIDSLNLWVSFSEPMDENKIAPNCFIIGNYDGSITELNWDNSFNESLHLSLSKPLKTGIDYTLKVKVAVQDCEGNALEKENYPFQLAVWPQSGSCLFNEIHYEPASACAEFIEIVNTQANSIVLESMLLMYKRNENAEWESVKLSNQPAQSAAGNFLVITSDTLSFNACYNPCSEAKIIVLDDFPTLSNEGGYLRLETVEGTIIDQVHYQPEMHFDKLASNQGVSLERIHQDVSSDEMSNWTSAAYTANYQTAGCPNSQHRSTSATSNIEILPKAFTPNNDGHEDQTVILVENERNEASVTIRIFTSSGMPVRTLANNALLGTQNTFIWDGKDKQGELLEAGIYIMHIEVYESNKPAEQYRRSCTLLR